MTEDFIQYVWKMRLLDMKNLHTVDGMPIEVLQPGWWNRDSGPDFLNARLKIGQTEWAGNVELHLKTSDWHKHGHDDDKAYDNVVLHAVYENDLEEDSPIPLVQLKDYILPNATIGYTHLMQQPLSLPCAPRLREVSTVISSAWLERIFVERLEEKVNRISVLLQQHRNDKAEVFHQWLARYFGAPVNSMPFERLARLVPMTVIQKHRKQLLHIEALLFGTAGFLNEEVDDIYYRRLKKEFNHLQRLHDITPMETHEWKFMRMRPQSFPTVRIALLAAVLFKADNVYSRMLIEENLKRLCALFHAHPSAHWKRHYDFGKVIPFTARVPLSAILLNAVVPFMFLEGKSRGDETLVNRALDIARGLPAEQNRVTKIFATAGLVPQNALESQAMLHLHTNYCNLRRCLHCSIGHAYLKLSELMQDETVKTPDPATFL